MKAPDYCLILEDHALARDWLARATGHAFPEATTQTASTIKEARRLIEARTPDLALVDLGLPDGSGLSIINLLCGLRKSVQTRPIIVVSSVMNDDESIFGAIRAGADGYILKEAAQPELISMLQGILEDKPPLSPSIALRLLNHFRAEPSEDQLAPRERQVLQLLAKGFTVPKVADMLGITHNTAASYVKEIYRKLNVNSRAEATLEASRRGLV